MVLRAPGRSSFGAPHSTSCSTPHREPTSRWPSGVSKRRRASWTPGSCTTSRACSSTPSCSWASGSWVGSPKGVRSSPEAVLSLLGLRCCGGLGEPHGNSSDDPHEDEGRRRKTRPKAEEGGAIESAGFGFAELGFERTSGRIRHGPQNMAPAQQEAPVAQMLVAIRAPNPARCWGTPARRTFRVDPGVDPLLAPNL